MTTVTALKCEHAHGHGSSRSWFRWIASLLPISTGKRLLIRIPTVGSPRVQSNDDRYEATGEIINPEPVGLALLPYLEDDEEDYMEICEDNGADSATGESNEGEAARITALKLELARLKAQIAQYALAQMNEETAPAPTALSASSAPAPPPPPPPPLPPQTQSTSVATTSAPSTQVTEVGEACPSSGQPATDQPDMSELLQGIGNVRLRRVQGGRSPGGTPLRPTNKQGTFDPNDPISIIREAVRRKFSHPVFQESPYRDSPDKENWNQSDSSFSGFESPTARLLK